VSWQGLFTVIVSGVSCPGCGGEFIRQKEHASWAERRDKSQFYWQCLICRIFFNTKRFFMQFTESDRIKRAREAMREEKGLIPTEELQQKIRRLEGLIERFGPIDESYHI
jgi:hypothetical protein